MQRITPHQEQQGFMTIAQNTADTDYLQLAYVQAISIKGTMPGSKYAVAVDSATRELINEKHLSVFDYIIDITHDLNNPDSNWKLANEWQVFYLTPFKETIKLESDIVFTRSIAHWWTTFRLRNIVLSTGCKDYQQQLSHTRAYRKLFDDNQLPDVYNGLMYFRYSAESARFFKIAEQLFYNWAEVKGILIKCHDEKPTTDVVYAIAAKILGVELCTLPIDWINFVHMKPAVNGWPNKPWHELVITELDLPMIRINNVNQYHPVHYYEKTWITDEVVREYEQWMNS